MLYSACEEKKPLTRVWPEAVRRLKGGRGTRQRVRGRGYKTTLQEETKTTLQEEAKTTLKQETVRLHTVIVHGWRRFGPTGARWGYWALQSQRAATPGVKRLFLSMTILLQAPAGEWPPARTSTRQCPVAPALMSKMMRRLEGEVNGSACHEAVHSAQGIRYDCAGKQGAGGATHRISSALLATTGTST